MNLDVGRLRNTLGQIRERYEECLVSYMADLNGTIKDRALEAHTRGCLLDQMVREFG